MGDLDFIKVKHLHIDYDRLDLDLLNKVLQEETSFQWCISCGCCTASCSAGNHTTFNVRRISLLLRRGEIESLEKELEKCMLCGKCTLVCPRDIQLRNVVMSIKKNILKYKMTTL
ncbi:MAG TPA: 4Fe-4S dicluster domain-containing protein [Bacteroidales bacterium]|jgi:heterodisulfide reductase subunit C|nr:4Fe-4S dicluster domain-containing protein [Bacteroidales bacterium]HCM29392.1 (4Fe-4S)-binding protein [Bacteroidales bacterium]HNY75829.1 4Fe-4S dicluster domain-containing protein [Bacteroidales bacterium]HOC40472.1 4Fe-4S dicluster domain-containing protein [Bacteroidales bacterium]HOF07373.1 4Fe-4S dicluster domain-containing protein [Bacteroidales bacterium]